MKKIIILVSITLLLSISAYASETGASFTIGNNNLPKNPMTNADFPVKQFPWGGSFFWKKEANDVSGIDIGFYRDPILQNIGYTNFYYNEEIFKIVVGPFFGLLNNYETIIKPGIYTSIRFNIPGIAFAQFRTQSTIGGRLVKKGDYIQEANNIMVGFYVYNAICKLMIDTKSYTDSVSATQTQTKDYTEYAFIADLFQKNVPYNLKLKIAYQARSRILENKSMESLNSVVLGTDFSFSLFRFISILVGLESSLYSFGTFTDLSATPSTKELLTFEENSFLFNAKIGFSIDLDKI